MEQETQQDGTSAEIRDPEAVLAALDRAKQDAKKYREDYEALTAEVTKRDEEIAKYSGKLLREKVEKEIVKLNISNSDRLFKYLNLSTLTFDDEFNVIGLEDQIEEIKKDFPELFDPKLLVGGKANSAEAIPVEKRLSASELQAMAILGRK